MRGKRHEIIGIKQAIRFEWMQETANLLIAGLSAKTIRHELHKFLTHRRGDGSEGKRSDRTKTFAVNNLMTIWVSPDPELIPLRDASLVFLRERPSQGLAVHWGMITAVYPFWFNTARQTGRLLALQNQVTQKQIVSRLKEQYGDRQTVSRCAQHVIRSFVAWGVLKDAKARGCYEKAIPLDVADSDLAILMFESALHATPEGREPVRLLLNNPSFFPFQLPMITGDLTAQRSERIDVVHCGLDDKLLKLKDR